MTTARTPTMTISRECAIPKRSAHPLRDVMRDRNLVTNYATAVGELSARLSATLGHR